MLLDFLALDVLHSHHLTHTFNPVSRHSGRNRSTTSKAYCLIHVFPWSVLTADMYTCCLSSTILPCLIELSHDPLWQIRANSEEKFKAEIKRCLFVTSCKCIVMYSQLLTGPFPDCAKSIAWAAITCKCNYILTCAKSLHVPLLYQ